jgi:hypothetical protein
VALRRFAVPLLGLALAGCAVVAPTIASRSASIAAPTADPSMAVLGRPLAFPTCRGLVLGGLRSPRWWLTKPCPGPGD